MYQSRRHLLQIHTTTYMPFVQERWLIEINLRPMGAAIPSPFESATANK